MRWTVGLAVALGSLHAAQAATCKGVDDSSSKFATSLTSLLGTDVPVGAFSGLSDAVPWLSKCAGAIDVQAIVASIAASTTVKNCVSTLENYELDFTTAAGRTSGCSMLTNTVIPCINSTMTEVVMDAISSTGGCCDDMQAQFKTLFGNSLQEMVVKLMQKAANVVCSTRSFTNLAGSKTTEVCGYSIINSFGFVESDDEVASLLNLIQIPNDQMCSAMAGKSFTNTKQATATIGFGTKGADTMGICTKPLDELIQYLASWPLFSVGVNAGGTTIKLSDLFTSGKSIRGNLLLAYVSTEENLPMEVFHFMDDLIAALSSAFGEGSYSTTGSYSTSWDASSYSSEGPTSIADAILETVNNLNSAASALLMHIPNNGACVYDAQTLTEPYPATTAVESTSTASRAIPMAELSGLALAGVAAVSAMLMRGAL